jgi:RimJ/RimL family protein N-acetyltransferase
VVEEFELKIATIQDMKDIFELSNDDLVRKNSFNQKKIEWEEHQVWFKNKINDKNSVFYVVRKNNYLIAQVRFDKSNVDEFDISISISPNFRRQGYGKKILKLVSDKVISQYKIKKINAYIKSENETSKKMFDKVGYILKQQSKDRNRYEYYAK